MGNIRSQPLTLALTRQMLTAGAVLKLGEDPIAGVAWSIPSGATEPEWLEPLTAGTLELTQAGLGPGAVVSGRFRGSTEEAPQPAEELFDFGTLEVSFETAWGTNQSANPFEEGTIAHLLSDAGEESVEGLGVIAGQASPDERLLMPGVKDLASIAVLGYEDDGWLGLVGMTLVMPKALLTGGATLVIGEDSIAGGIWAIPAGATEPEIFLPFSEGTLVLAESGTEPGAVIAGSFSGSFGTMTDGEPTRRYSYDGGIGSTGSE